MLIKYEDDYGVYLTQQECNYPPSVGDSVIIQDDEYRVAGRTFIPASNIIIISVTQNSVKATLKVDNNSGRLSEMNSAIMALNKRQDLNEKKGRALTEQISTVRRHINQRTQQEKKDNESR